MGETLAISLADVQSAAEMVTSRIHRTPLLTCQTLSDLTGTRLWLKAENLQRTGAFKVRGAINAVSRLPEEDLRRGVVTISAGNHGMALAFAAQAAGTRATVVMPEGAVESKVAAIRGYGGRPVLVDGTKLMENMEAVAAEERLTFIHPFDYPMVTAGQGTVGLEVLQDLPDVEVVVVPVGGGGLISGIVTAVKGLNPRTLVFGVEPDGSTAVSQSLAAGRAVKLSTFGTVADGLNAPFGAPNTFAIICALVDDIVTVSDAEILTALGLILERSKLLVEPAGAAAVAALLLRKWPQIEGKKVVAILSGGNVDRSKLSTFLSEPGVNSAAS